MKNFIWKILFIIGLIPFLGCLVYAIYNSIVGFTGLCLFECEEVIYGLEAIEESIILYSYMFWPSYIVGLMLVVLSIIKMRKRDYE